MNPQTYVRRWCVSVVALATMTVGLIFMASCGGNALIQPLGGGFSNSSLNGQYVFAVSGVGVNQAGGVSAFSEVVTFTADGSGHLTGVIDDFAQSGGPFSDTTTGSYSISRDGTGSITLNFSPTNTNYAITMIDDSHFYVMEEDIFATSSGYGEKQDTSAFAAVPTGAFVFKAHNLRTTSRVGELVIAGGGGVTGTEDLLTSGLLSQNKPITGNFSTTPPDPNGRGQFSLSDNSVFEYYVVNASKIRFLTLNGASLEIGQAEVQTGAPFSLATLGSGNSYVFGSSGDTGFSLGIHSGGVFTSNGAGEVTGGMVDIVADANLSSGIAVNSGTYTLDPTSGRGQLDLTFSGSANLEHIFWMVSPTKAYFLVNSSSAVEDGVFNLQTGGPFSNSSLSGQAALVMDGTDTTYKDRTGVFQPTSGGGLKWKQTANAFDPVAGGLITETGTNGSATVDASGRATVTVSGVTGSLVFYLISPNNGVMVQEDADIGGAFSQQASQ